jgi:hypothetical protein
VSREVVEIEPREDEQPARIGRGFGQVAAAVLAAAQELGFGDGGEGFKHSASFWNGDSSAMPARLRAGLGNVRLLL